MEQYNYYLYKYCSCFIQNRILSALLKLKHFGKRRKYIEHIYYLEQKNKNLKEDITCKDQALIDRNKEIKELKDKYESIARKS